MAQSRFIAGGEYELLEPLGHGGMGEVWKARQHGPAGFNRLVVVKRILRHLADDARFVEMFLAEARLTARLQHPNIVTLLNMGQDDKGYYLVIEYLAGISLSRLLENRYEPPPPGLGALAVRDVGRALAYAYETPGEDGQPLRLVHRDVSPSNVMLALDGTSKLLDFGVAKALAFRAENNPKTETGVIKGKLWYTAPERLAGKPFDQRADLFSAGLVLYEALTGVRLFQESSVLAMEVRMEQPIVRPSRYNRTLPEALDRICMRALAMKPEERYFSGRDLAAALDAVLADLGWDAECQAAWLAENLGKREDATARMPPPAADVSDRTVLDKQVLAAKPATPRPAGGEKRADGGWSTEPISVDSGIHVSLDSSAGASQTEARIAVAPTLLKLSEVESAAGDATTDVASWDGKGHIHVRSGNGAPPGERLLPPVIEDVPPGSDGSSRQKTVFRHTPTGRAGRSSRRGLSLALLLTLAVALAGAGGYFGVRFWRSTTVMVSIVSDPPGARFVLDGNPPEEGVTPWRGRVAQATAQRHLKVTLSGYSDVELEIDPRTDTTAHVVLKPAPK